MTQHDFPGGVVPPTSVKTTIVTPFDRVRWGPILGGLFAALSTLALLSVLGVAIGLSAWDPGDNTRNYQVGAGIWSIVSAIIAFFVGGWLAARSAAAAGERNGVMNGALVWAVAIPLLIFMLGGGMASMAGSVLNNGNRVVYVDRQSDFDRARPAAGQMDATSSVQSPSNAANNLPATEEDARTAAKGAWWTLVSLVLGLCAAGAGGYFGARGDYYSRDRGIGSSVGT
jgi:hypothetical protein